MYEDQAAELRNLVHQVGSRRQSVAPPYIVVVAGGRSGVGTSTIAATTATVLARQGRGVVLVEADSRSPKLGSLFPDGEAISDDAPADQQIGQRSRITEGFDLLTAPWCQSKKSDVGSLRLSDLNHFASQLPDVASDQEFLIVDVGNGASPEMRALWAVSHAAIVTTTPDTETVMESYATIKAMHSLQAEPLILATVNQSTSKASAADVFRRLSQSCHRFLNQELLDGGGIPHDILLANSLNESTKGVPGNVDSPAVCAVDQVVCQLKAQLGQQAVRRSA